MSQTQPLHATTLARYGPDGWRGVLLMGPSGVGKSDLALRMMAQGWALVADDWTTVWKSGERLFASAPPSIQGLIEVRGAGILKLGAGQAARPIAPLYLAVTLGHEAVERLPEPQVWTCQGVTIKHLRLDPRPASASLIVSAALTAL